MAIPIGKMVRRYTWHHVLSHTGWSWLTMTPINFPGTPALRMKLNSGWWEITISTPPGQTVNVTLYGAEWQGTIPANGEKTIRVHMNGVDPGIQVQAVGGDHLGEEVWVIATML